MLVVCCCLLLLLLLLPQPLPLPPLRLLLLLLPWLLLLLSLSLFLHPALRIAKRDVRDGTSGPKLRDRWAPGGLAKRPRSRWTRPRANSPVQA